MPWIHREWAPTAQAPFHSFSQSVLLWVEQADASVEPRYLSLQLPSFFFIIFLHTFQEAILTLWVLNMLNSYINSLGKNLAFNLFIYDNAHRMLGDIVDCSSLSLVTFVGQSFLNGAHSLNICNTTFLVDSHVCSQRSNSVFSKRLRQHVTGTSPLSLCVSHFGELLEDGSSGKKSYSFSFWCTWQTWGFLSIKAL